MPKPIDWTPLIPHALQQLRAMRSRVVDRATLERLLKIHRRTAIRLMHQFGGEQAGKTFLVDREHLIDELAAYLPSDSSEYAPRLSSQVKRLHAEAAEFRFPGVHTTVERRTVGQLPQSIQITPGRLVVETANLRDLCAQLWIFLETCQDDRDTLEQRLTRQ